MLLPRFTQSSPLVQLHAVTQELSLGVGCATASVRTLSDVSLTVGAGELVVLAGARGAGERAMLAVIAGDRRGVTGSCDIPAGTVVRLLRIGAAAALTLAKEWERAAARAAVAGYGTAGGTPGRLFSGSVPHARTTAGARRQLFLLDVQPGAPAGVHDADLMFQWAAACQRRGCAVVMAAGAPFGRGLLELALRRTEVRQHVRHAAAAMPADRHRAAARAGVREAPLAVSAVRIVAMHCGRLAPSVSLHRDSATAESHPMGR